MFKAGEITFCISLKQVK